MRSFTFQHLRNMMMMMLFMKIRFLTQILCSFFNPPHILLATTLVLAILLYFYLKSHHVYLIDFSCYQAPDTMRAPISSYIEHTVLLGDKFQKDSRDFLLKIFPRSGVGSEASMPDSMHHIPLDVSMKSTIAEIETVLFTVVEDLLVKHNISPKSIDILVSNNSVSCPTPSITAMIINKFKFRSNIMSFSLAGMGCSAGLLSISLAKDLLKVHKNSLALVVTMEAITPHGYMGQNKSMLLTNTLFRMGGAAILVSNRKQDKTTAKYELQHLVRTNMGFDDQSYRGIVHEEDEDGTVGINLSPKLLHVAGKGLRTNSTTLGPLVLPYSEIIKYGWSIICQKLCAPLWRKEVYIPDLKMAFDHFCIHAGGKRVIDAVAESLSLCEEDVEPSRMALYRFGNTSSSSIWYELCYLEAKGKMKKGDKVWQIAFGSGFKCNSGVWKCLSDVDPNVKSAWSDRIHRYPVEIPDQVDH